MAGKYDKYQLVDITEGQPPGGGGATQETVLQ